MSMAMTAAPIVVYREEQWFARWVYGLLAAVMGVVCAALYFAPAGPVAAELPGTNGGLPFALMIGMSLPPLLLVGLLKMTTQVSATELQVWFGLVPTYRHVLSLDSIRGVEVVKYRPVLDCGGWGIRWHRGGGRVLNARGNRGVRLTLDDGSHLLVGSQRPEELARVIDGAIRPTA